MGTSKGPITPPLPILITSQNVGLIFAYQCRDKVRISEIKYGWLQCFNETKNVIILDNLENSMYLREFEEFFHLLITYNFVIQGHLALQH